MSDKGYRGSCLCGGVGYEIYEPFRLFQYCHCSRCRKFTGSAHTSNLFVPPDQFKWTRGEELLGRFELSEANYFATSFCKQCGSSLPWMPQTGGVWVVPAGSLDDDPGARPVQSIHWGSRAAWYLGCSDLPKYKALPDKRQKNP